MTVFRATPLSRWKKDLPTVPNLGFRGNAKGHWAPFPGVVVLDIGVESDVIPCAADVFLLGVVELLVLESSVMLYTSPTKESSFSQPAYGSHICVGVKWVGPTIDTSGLLE